MGIKAVVESLDEVDEKYHDLYTARDGKYELTGVDGMRTEADVLRVQSSLTKERSDHKLVKERLRAFGELNADEVLAKLDLIPELEAAAAGKLDDAAINGIVETRIKTRIAPLERELGTYKAQSAEKDVVIGNYQARDRQTAISTAITKAAKAIGVTDGAIEDAVVLGERVFELDENGDVRAKDGVGCTPGVDPQVWLTEMQDKKPHWWGESFGGGATGGNRAGKTVVNPWTHENWNSTAQTKIYKESATRAEQMAKSAGTTLGGSRPAAKK